MKTFTGVLLFAALSLAAPLHAQTTEPQQPAAGTTASTDAQPKPAETTTKKAETPKKPKVAKAPKTQGPAAVNYDGSVTTGEPKEKKVATKHSGTVPVVKEGGKTCSGRDEYRVCW